MLAAVVAYIKKGRGDTQETKTLNRVPTPKLPPKSTPKQVSAKEKCDYKIPTVRKIPKCITPQKRRLSVSIKL